VRDSIVAMSPLRLFGGPRALILHVPQKRLRKRFPRRGVQLYDRRLSTGD
jgi:hypothetical protein